MSAPITTSISPRVRAGKLLRQGIVSGRYPRGERLPPEVALASHLQVSRGTLRTVLVDLERQGYILRRRNQGCIVSPNIKAAGLLADTVVLLSDAPGEVTSSISGGRLQAMNSGIYDSVVAARMSFLSVAGAPASDETIGRLLADPPKAVLINATFGGRAPHAQQSIARLASTGVPVVMHYGDSGFEMADRVGSDHEGGAYQVARWLAGQGRQRILRLWIGDGSGWWLQAHDRGYERAMAECGLPSLPPLVVPGLIERRIGDRENFDIRTRQMVGFLLDRLDGADPVDAVMAATDGDAYLVSAACRLLGRRPNEDVLIAGYDNYWAESPEREWCDVPPAVTVDKQNRRIGEELVRLMLDRLNGRLPAERQYRSVEQQLKVTGG